MKDTGFRTNGSRRPTISTFLNLRSSEETHLWEVEGDTRKGSDSPGTIRYPFLGVVGVGARSILSVPDSSRLGCPR